MQKSSSSSNPITTTMTAVQCWRKAAAALSTSFLRTCEMLTYGTSNSAHLIPTHLGNVGVLHQQLCAPHFYAPGQCRCTAPAALRTSFLRTWAMLAYGSSSSKVMAGSSGRGDGGGCSCGNVSKVRKGGFCRFGSPPCLT
jgi:hypothetical protein